MAVVIMVYINQDDCRATLLGLKITNYPTLVDSSSKC
jgi:hypothetical protein